MIWIRQACRFPVQSSSMIALVSSEGVFLRGQHDEEAEYSSAGLQDLLVRVAGTGRASDTSIRCSGQRAFNFLDRCGSFFLNLFELGSLTHAVEVARV